MCVSLSSCSKDDDKDDGGSSKSKIAGYWVQELYLSPTQWSKSYTMNYCGGYHFKTNGEVEMFDASFDRKEISDSYGLGETMTYGSKTIYLSKPHHTYLWIENGDDYIIDPANDPAFLKMTSSSTFIRSWSGTSSSTFKKISD